MESRRSPRRAARPQHPWEPRKPLTHQETGALFRKATHTSAAAQIHDDKSVGTFTKVHNKKPPLPGYVECEWLLEEYRNEVLDDVRMLLRKGENDLMRMARR